jgi:pimeloyl-ACP methyl ester carboxylesterase
MYLYLFKIATFAIMSNSQFISHNNLKLEYLTYGSGSIPLLAFHGFGRHAEDYQVFEQLFGDKYTIYSFNLFHHGNSKYPSERVEANTFTKTEFKEIFNQFFNQFSNTKFGVMGYSLGGKIALMFTEIFPEKIESLWLFAPDGVKLNFWYIVASKTALGRGVYKYFLENPSIFFSMVNGLHRTKLINDKLKKFAINNMDEKEKRELVYTVWLTFKNTNPKMNVCISNILAHKIPVNQFFGKNDKVIKPQLGDRFSKKINQPENYHVLQAGHNLLTTRTCKYIESLRIL